MFALPRLSCKLPTSTTQLASFNHNPSRCSRFGHRLYTPRYFKNLDRFMILKVTWRRLIVKVGFDIIIVIIMYWTTRQLQVQILSPSALCLQRHISCALFVFHLNLSKFMLSKKLSTIMRVNEGYEAKGKLSFDVWWYLWRHEIEIKIFCPRHFTVGILNLSATHSWRGGENWREITRVLLRVVKRSAAGNWLWAVFYKTPVSSNIYQYFKFYYLI